MILKLWHATFNAGFTAMALAVAAIFDHPAVWVFAVLAVVLFVLGGLNDRDNHRGERRGRSQRSYIGP